jgi:nucleoside-triphosphatase THEP1
MSIVILSREIRSGKTTELFNWVNTNKNLSGILMPDQEGRRMFYDIAERIFFPAQADANSSNTITAGPYVFDAEAFEKAGRVIEKATSDPDTLIVIDEIGKLEMEDKGFSKILYSLVEGDQDLLIVVRDSLVNAVVDKFGLADARIISSMKDY